MVGGEGSAGGTVTGDGEASETVSGACVSTGPAAVVVSANGVIPVVSGWDDGVSASAAGDVSMG